MEMKIHSRDLEHYINKLNNSGFTVENTKKEGDHFTLLFRERIKILHIPRVPVQRVKLERKPSKINMKSLLNRVKKISICDLSLSFGDLFKMMALIHC